MTRFGSPFDRVSDGDGYRAAVAAVARLAGHQVVSLERAWTELTGREPDEMTALDRHYLRYLLHELGYESQWVVRVDEGPMLHRWVRGPWPIDFGAVRRNGATAYLSAS